MAFTKRFPKIGEGIVYAASDIASCICLVPLHCCEEGGFFIMSGIQERTVFHLGYRPALDGVRGVAVLAVLAGYLKLPFAAHGALGVDIFFTLSGFLITVLLSEERSRTGTIHLGQFYMRRVIRLYPALLFMLFLISFITPAWEYILSSLTYTTNVAKPDRLCGGIRNGGRRAAVG